MAFSFFCFRSVTDFVGLRLRGRKQMDSRMRMQYWRIRFVRWKARLEGTLRTYCFRCFVESFAIKSRDIVEIKMVRLWLQRINLQFRTPVRWVRNRNLIHQIVFFLQNCEQNVADTFRWVRKMGLTFCKVMGVCKIYSKIISAIYRSIFLHAIIY